MRTPSRALLLILLFVFGCGKSAPINSVQSVREDPIEGGETLESQKQAAKNGNLTCEFSDECEPALSMVSIAVGSGLRRCTGFLISNHEVMTNDHCVNSIPAESCSGVIFAHFSDNVHRGCKRISIRSHQTGINSKDYAVIELDAPIVDRKPLHLSRRGFNNLESATLYSVQAGYSPISKTYDGQQVKRICQASYSTMMGVNIASSREPLMSFGDCAIQAGNSGSPVINDEGSVGAIVQGFLSVKGDEFSETLKKHLLDSSYGQVAIATQTRCMPELVGMPSRACEPVKAFTALYPEEYLQEFGKFSEKFLPKISNDEIWRSWAVALSNEKKFFSSPQCVKPAEASNGYRFTSSVLTLHLGINAKLQAEWRSIDPKETLFVSQRLQGTVNSSIDFVSDDFGKISVPACVR